MLTQRDAIELYYFAEYTVRAFMRGGIVALFLKTEYYSKSKNEVVALVAQTIQPAAYSMLEQEVQELDVLLEALRAHPNPLMERAAKAFELAQRNELKRLTDVY